MNEQMPLNKIKILALFGESSSGKDTIQNWICSNIENTYKIISCTTRPPRDYEEDGKDYFFIPSKEEFTKKYLNDEILEFTIFNDWFYGTPRVGLEADKINVGVFNLEGIYTLLKNKDFDILPLYIRAEDRLRLMRSLYREKNPNCTEICRRFLADKQDFLKIDFNYESFNNNIEFDPNQLYNFLLNNKKIYNFLAEGQSKLI